MRAEIWHPPFYSNQKTYLSSDVNSGVTSLPVKNNTGFTTSKFALLGVAGVLEQTELVTISSLTDTTTIGVSATKYAHFGDTLVTLLDFDKIKVYRSTTGISGTYDYYATVNIQYDHEFTVYEDTDAQPTYYYKYSYYNSLNSTEDDLSDAIGATGFIFYSLNTIIRRGLSAYGDPNGRTASFAELRDVVNDLYMRGQQELSVRSKRYMVQKIEIPLVVGQESYPIDSSFLVEKAVEIKSSGQSEFRGIPSRQVDSLGKYDYYNYPYSYYVIDQSIYFDPIPRTSGDVARVFYVPFPYVLQYQTDTLRTSFILSSEYLVKAVHAHLFLKEQRMEEFKLLRSLSENGMNNFIDYLVKMGNKHPQLVENVR